MANGSVFALFFHHGAKLQHETVIADPLHWQRYAIILLASLPLFPLFGIPTRLLPLISVVDRFCRFRYFPDEIRGESDAGFWSSGHFLVVH